MFWSPLLCPFTSTSQGGHYHHLEFKNSSAGSGESRIWNLRRPENTVREHRISVYHPLKVSFQFALSAALEMLLMMVCRFDMIFLVRDKKDAMRDKAIAHHVVDVHMHTFDDVPPVQIDGDGDQVLDPMWLRRFIAFARSRYMKHACLFDVHSNSLELMLVLLP